MPTHAALRITDNIAEERQRDDATALDPAFGEQAALVRALVDEVDRHNPEDPGIVPLRQQLGDELLRLARLIEGQPAPGAAGQERALDVLVVDDDDYSLRASVAALRSLGYPCRTARDGEEAVREFDREPAAIVLSDWSMPGMNGLQLCVTLKGREPRPYVILATGFPDNGQLLDGVRGGVDDFLRKPIDLGDLEERLLSACRLVRAVAAVAAQHQRLPSAAPGAPER